MTLMCRNCGNIYQIRAQGTSSTYTVLISAFAQANGMHELRKGSEIALKPWDGAHWWGGLILRYCRHIITSGCFRHASTPFDNIS